MLRYKRLTKHFLIGLCVALTSLFIWLTLDGMAQNFLEVVIGSLVVYIFGLTLLYLLAFGIAMLVEWIWERAQ